MSLLLVRLATATLMLSASFVTIAADQYPRALRIDDPASYWRDNGYRLMLPSIRLPTTHDRDDLIRVWSRVPADGKIDVVYLPDQGRYSLLFPPGTRSDRVEYYRVKDENGDATWTVADVRGTYILEDGSQRLHVYRPLGAAPHAALVGWSWPRGDDTAQQKATARLRAHARSHRRPKNKPPMQSDELQRLLELNECGGCHVPNQARVVFRAREDTALTRATDAMGFFVPTAVLSDRCVVAHHRPEDLNDEDPFVTVRCGAVNATLVTSGDYEEYVCPQGSREPIGYRDVRTALLADHPYTQGLCASRKYLYDHMTKNARQAYTDAFGVCGTAEYSEE